MPLNLLKKPVGPSNSSDRVIDAHYVLTNEIIHLNVLLTKERKEKKKYLRELRFIKQYQLSKEDKLELKRLRKDQRESVEEINPRLHPSIQQTISDLKVDKKMYKMENDELKISLNAAHSVLRQLALGSRRGKEIAEKMLETSAGRQSIIMPDKDDQKQTQPMEKISDLNAVYPNTEPLFRDEAEDKMLAKLDKDRGISVIKSHQHKSISSDIMVLHAKNEKLNQDLNLCLYDIEHEIETLHNLEDATNIKSSFSTQVSDLKRVIAAHEEEGKIVEMKMSKLHDLIKEKEVESKKEIDKLMEQNQELKAKLTDSNRRQTKLSMAMVDLEDIVSKNVTQKKAVELRFAKMHSMMIQKQTEAENNFNAIKKENEKWKSKYKAIMSEHFSDRFIDKSRRATSYRSMYNKKKMDVAMKQRGSMPNEQTKPNTELMKELFEQSKIDRLNAENAELKTGYEYNVITDLRVRVWTLTEKLRKANARIEEETHFYKVDTEQMNRLKKGFVALSRLVAKLRSVHVIFRDDIETKVGEAQIIMNDGLREIRSKGLEFMSQFERGMSKELLTKTANEYGVMCVSRVEELKEIIKNIRSIHTRDKESVHWSRATKVANNLIFGHVNSDIMNMTYDV